MAWWLGAVSHDGAQKGVSLEKPDGSGLRIGIVRATWNKDVIDALADGCVAELKECGVLPENIVSLEVPGSFELVFGAKRVIEVANVDAVVCIGCLVKGETMHFEYISEAVSQGIMRLGLDSGVPVLFGVLTCMTMEQASARAGLTEDGHNHGPEWARGAIQMALVKSTTSLSDAIGAAAGDSEAKQATEE